MSFIVAPGLKDYETMGRNETNIELQADTLHVHTRVECAD